MVNSVNQNGSPWNYRHLLLICEALQLDFSAPLTWVAAEACQGLHVPPFSVALPAVVFQLLNPEQMQHLSLLLAGYYAPDHPLQIVSMAGDEAGQVERVTLHDLSRLSWGGEAAVYIPAVSQDASFDAFQEVIARLRAPDGCPWDRKQTHQTLRSDLLSEVYEVLEALDTQDLPGLQEELGDLLMQIVLHAQIAREAGEFSMVDVVQGVSRKIIHRHPHVFGEAQVEGSDNVLVLWEKIKADERKQKGQDQHKGMLDGLPGVYPALAQAQEYQERVARVGFDWDEISGVWDKVFEELSELQQASTPRAQANELGDLLFALVNLSRWLKVDAESTLRETNQRFRQRFRFVEQRAREEGRTLSEMTLAEMDIYWDEAKQKERETGDE